MSNRESCAASVINKFIDKYVRPTDSLPSFSLSSRPPPSINILPADNASNYARSFASCVINVYLHVCINSDPFRNGTLSVAFRDKIFLRLMRLSFRGRWVLPADWKLDFRGMNKFHFFSSSSEDPTSLSFAFDKISSRAWLFAEAEFRSLLIAIWEWKRTRLKLIFVERVNFMERESSKNFSAPSKRI